MKNVLSAEDRQQALKDQLNLQVDIKPVEEDSQEQRYSNRSQKQGRDSPLQYDNANTETERVALKAENEKLMRTLYDLKRDMANKDEAIDDLETTTQQVHLRLAETEARLQEWRLAVEELAESSGKGEDREKKAWERLARVAGWNEAKSKEAKERLAKALHKKKGFF